MTMNITNITTEITPLAKPTAGSFYTPAQVLLGFWERNGLDGLLATHTPDEIVDIVIKSKKEEPP